MTEPGLASEALFEEDAAYLPPLEEHVVGLPGSEEERRE